MDFINSKIEDTNGYQTVEKSKDGKIKKESFFITRKEVKLEELAVKHIENRKKYEKVS
jgi:hypothetical protein